MEAAKQQLADLKVSLRSSAAVPPPLPSRTQQPPNEAQEEFQLTRVLNDFLHRSSRSAEEMNATFLGSISPPVASASPEILLAFKNGQMLPQCIGYLIQLDTGAYPSILSEASLGLSDAGERNELALQQASEVFGLPQLFSGVDLADGKVGTHSLLLYLTLLHSTEERILASAITIDEKFTTQYTQQNSAAQSESTYFASTSSATSAISPTPSNASPTSSATKVPDMWSSTSSTFGPSSSLLPSWAQTSTFSQPDMLRSSTNSLLGSNNDSSGFVSLLPPPPVSPAKLPPPLPPRPTTTANWTAYSSQQQQLQSSQSELRSAEFTSTSAYALQDHTGGAYQGSQSYSSSSHHSQQQGAYSSSSASSSTTGYSPYPQLAIPEPLPPNAFDTVVPPLLPPNQGQPQIEHFSQQYPQQQLPEQAYYASNQPVSSYNPAGPFEFPTLTTPGATTSTYNPQLSFPNEPTGGQWVNGMYITGTTQLHYSPQVHSSTITTTGNTSSKKKGLLGSSVAFAKRIAKEATHEFDKVYKVIDDSSSVQRFRKFFHFKYIEPFYGEHAVKFFTTASGGEAVMMIGYAYITENYFCFSGERATGRGSDRISAVLSLLDVVNIEAGISPFLDRYKEVPRVTPHRAAPSQSPNAAIITDRFGKTHEFYSILSVKQFLSQFNLQWQKALVRRQQQIPMQNASGLTATSTPTTSITSHQYY